MSEVADDMSFHFEVGPWGLSGPWRHQSRDYMG